MFTPLVWGVVLVPYVLGCIRAWQKLSKMENRD